VFTIADLPEHPGDIWFVDSGASGAADSAGAGQNPDVPFATLDYAIGKCTASNGDTIYVMPGHAETKSVTGSLWAADVIGVHIIGLGEGALRPTFTFSHTGAACTISAANVTLENVILVCGVDSVTAPLTISAADVTLRNVEYRDAANVEFVVGVTTTNAADRLHIDGLHYRGDMATGNALTVGIDLAGVADALIENCIFESNAASTAWVNFSVACTNVHVRNSLFNDKTTTLSKDVVDTATGSTWSVSKCFDLRGGYEFSGGSGSALASGDVSALAAAIATVDGYFDVPVADATGNTTMRDVVGIKTDAAATGSVSNVESLMAYAKQNVTAGIAAAAAIGVIDEFHDVPAANNVLNAQINEVIGNKEDTAATGAVTTTDTLVGYIKQLVTEAITADAWAIKTVKKTGLALDAGDVADVFTIAGGPIELLGLNMLVTTAVSANACACYFLTDPTLADYADTPLCAGADINAAAIGNVFSIIDADSATAWVKNADGTNVGRMMEIGSQFLMPGGIDFKAANADPSTGVADVYLTYRPLSSASTVTAS
jgi:hypothetical protein